MALKNFILFVILSLVNLSAGAQKSKIDSTSVANTLKALLSICKHVDFEDPKTSGMGIFYKAAPYIIYRGNDKKRAWKDFANYKNEIEKKGVDEICIRINETVNRDSTYKIMKYFTQKESEGIWHILMISYVKNNNEKKAAFAFLKIRNRFGLGDID